MTRPVRVGNAHGFWGDRLEAAREMLAREPDLDFLTLDFLAEVSMSILAVQRQRDPQAGWPRDFVEIVRSIAPYWRDGGRCRVVTNAGGLNPMACAQACCEVLKSAGCAGRTVAVVCGDDVRDRATSRTASGDGELLRNLGYRPGFHCRRKGVALSPPTPIWGHEPIGGRPRPRRRSGHHRPRRRSELDRRPMRPLVRLVVGMIGTMPWQGRPIAGHLIECGTQLTGGISTDWLQIIRTFDAIGFPIAEIAADGSCIVTKSRGSGGRVCEETVKEQLLYEIGDPGAYLSPDATVSLLSLVVEGCGEDRVSIRSARGRPAPANYKVSATYQDGFWAQGELTVFGADAVAKARRAGEAVLRRLAADGISFRETVVECLGAGACRPQGIDPIVAGQLTEVVLRIAAADDSREALERFARELMPLVTAGPPGTTGYAEGRPRVHPLFRFWPCLLARDRVEPQIEMLVVEGSAPRKTAGRISGSL